MIRFVQTLVIVLFMLSGCAVMQYEHPEDPAAPTVTFINNSRADVAVLGFADAATCRNQINISKKTSRYMDLPSGKSEQIQIRSDEVFSFLVSMRSFPNECFMVGTLIPSRSNNYTASIFYDGKMCYVSVMRLQDGIEVPDKAFIPRVFKMPFSSSFPACADKLP
jgi:hypothetical protein